MRTEEEIRAMVKRCEEVPVGGELEVEGDWKMLGHFTNRYNFWEGLGEFMDALEWVLNDKEEK